MKIDIDLKDYLTQVGTLDLIRIVRESSKELASRTNRLLSEKTLAAAGDLLVEDLDLSVRGYNVLKRGGVFTVRELLLVSEEELLSMRRMGQKSVDEIKSRLEELLSESTRVAEFINDMFADDLLADDEYSDLLEMESPDLVCIREDSIMLDRADSDSLIDMLSLSDEALIEKTLLPKDELDTLIHESEAWINK
jgi:hypothetical protein